MDIGYTKHFFCFSSLSLGFLQLIYGFFASAAARQLNVREMLEAGVLPAMRKDPLLALIRQSSADTQVTLSHMYVDFNMTYQPSQIDSYR